MTSGCATATPIFEIGVAGYNIEDTNLNHIDMAAAEVANLIGLQASKVRDAKLLIQLWDEVISFPNWPEEQYSGLTVNGTILHIRWTPCVFDYQNVTMHELTHAFLCLKTATGPNKCFEDSTHLDPIWKLIDASRARMEARYCNGKKHP